MGQRRSAGEIEELVEGYRKSGLGRGAYCRRVGVGVHILSYYLRRQVGDQGLVRVNLVAEASEASPGFALVLSNRRRIESQWGFDEAGLARLIRVAESV